MLDIKKLFTFIVIFLGFIITPSTFAAPAEWQSFKSRFVDSQGRVVDTGNHDISHSEGQGYGMFLAVIYDDPSTFTKIWQWTEENLYREDIGLFAWRYDPKNERKITDYNNASDGDTLIAWSLLLAGKKWGNNDYLKKSKNIQAAIIERLVIVYGDYVTLLPGVVGFHKENKIVINPSYFIFPAWQAFAKEGIQRDIWQSLKQSSDALLCNMQFGRDKLPSDWVDFYSDGTLKPAQDWPARFSYDAIRIPLYIYMEDSLSERLAVFKLFWSSYPINRVPAWVDIKNGERANYAMNNGMLSVRNLVLNQTTSDKNKLNVTEDYYSTVLYLLSASTKSGVYHKIINLD